jgi:hypothetical protein
LWPVGVFFATLLAGAPGAAAYNGPTHALLFSESVEHLRRLGLTDAYRYFTTEVGLPDPREGVQWPDFSTTGRPDADLAPYVLCHTVGCADPGDGDAERKNLDATRWSPWGAGTIRDALLAFGRSYLGPELMATQKATAEHQYAPDSRAEEYQVYLEVDLFRWPVTVRLASLGPLRWRTAYNKVGEYAQRALDGVRACDARPGLVWASRTIHFFQDLTAPNRTHLPTPSVKVSLTDASLVIQAFENLALVNSMACYGRYSDWIEANADSYLQQIRLRPAWFPVTAWPGSFPAAARETLNTVARIARQYSGDTDCTPPSDYGRAASVLLPLAVRIGAELLYNYYLRVADTVAGPPSPPADLTCTRTGDTCSLRWRDTSRNELGFRIFAGRGEGCADRSLVGEVPANATSFQWRSPLPPSVDAADSASDTLIPARECVILEVWNGCGSRAATLVDGCRASAAQPLASVTPGSGAALEDAAEGEAPATPLAGGGANAHPEIRALGVTSSEVNSLGTPVALDGVLAETTSVGPRSPDGPIVVDFPGGPSGGAMPPEAFGAPEPEVRSFGCSVGGDKAGSGPGLAWLVAGMALASLLWRRHSPRGPRGRASGQRGERMD